MRPLAATLLILVLACGLAVGGATWVLQSSARSVEFARWAVAQFSNFRLEFVSAQLAISEGRIEAGQLLLYPRDNPDLPLLAIHGLEASFAPRDLLRHQLRRARVQADNVTVYTGPGDPEHSLRPASWMRFLKWLPARLDVGSAHLLRHEEELLVFPLRQLSGELLDRNSYRLHATGNLQGEPLDSTIHLYAMRNERGLRGIQLRADLHATRSSRVAVLEGELLGGSERFSYDFSLNAALPDIQSLALRERGLTGLEGALQMRGRIRGDLDRFHLSEAEFGLFNAPAYEFVARGEFDYRGPGDTLLQARASGQIEQLGLLLDWFDLDLTAFGSARAELELRGSLAALEVPAFTLTTRHSEGLEISLEGSLGPGALAADATPQPGNAVQLRASGPDLSVLAPWLGSLPRQTGSWQVTALATGRREQLTLDNIQGRFGEPGSTIVKATGRIGQIHTTAPFAPASVQGIDLQLSAEAESLEELNQWYATGLDPTHRLTVSAAVSGSGDAPQLTDLNATLAGSDLTLSLSEARGAIGTAPWALRQLEGQLSATISDTSALSQYFPASIPVLGAASATAELAGSGGHYRLSRLRGEIDSEQVLLSLRGEVPDLRSLDSTRLDIDFSRLDLRNLIHTLVDDFSYPRPLGQLAGQLALVRDQGAWHVPAMAIASQGEPSLQLRAEGTAHDVTGTPRGAARLQLSIDDRALLKALSGRDLPALQASLEGEAGGGRIDLTGNTTLASTALTLRGQLEHHNRQVQGLTLALASPAVRLADLGLQAGDRQGAPSQSAANNPSRQREAPFSLEGFIGSLPRYPLDLQMHLGTVRGDNIDLTGVDLAIDGRERRYLLRQLDLRGRESRVELAGVIDLAAQPPGISLAGQARALDMRQIVRDLGLQADIAGILNLRGGLSARGNHRGEWLGSLDGNVSMALEDVEIEGAAYDLLATDLLAWLYSGAALETSTHVDCTMASFSLRAGVANSDNLFAESPRMIATGKGKFDLVRETLDVRIRPLSKNRVLQFPSSITLTGKLRKPRTWVSPITATVDASAEALMLIPSLTLKLLGLRRDDAKPVRPCEALPPS